MRRQAATRTRAGAQRTDKFLRKVETTIRRFGMLKGGEKVLIGLSGGPDSTALTHSLVALAGRWNLRLHLAHLNHGLRGAESDGDQAYCEELAHRLDLPLASERVDVAGSALRGESVEMAARRIRHDFLRRAQEQTQCDCIALGHTADDQVETVFLNLLRGAGVRGLAGMVPRSRTGIIRPLIQVWRREVEAYCEVQRLEPRHDTTNLDAAYLRNWLRVSLFPEITSRLGSDGWRKSVLRSADHCRQGSQLARTWNEVASLLAAGGCKLGEAGGETQDAGWLSPLLAELCMDTSSGGRMEMSEVGILEQLGKWLRSPLGAALADAAEVAFSRERKRAAVERHVAVPGKWGPVALRVPGQTALPAVGKMMEAAWATDPGGRNSAWLRWGAVQGGLWARSWLPGDRIQPFGMQGRKKVQDLLCDLKLGPAEKAWVTIVLDGAGTLFWVAPYCASEAGRVTDTASPALRLTFADAAQPPDRQGEKPGSV